MFKQIKLAILTTLLLVAFQYVSGQSEVTKTYINPVIPGDHPDPTLTQVGNDFYTSGSSFNPTPKIYHSTDLVHWEVISQPVSASWSGYGDMPGDGIWGGHMVFYNGKYWHFFGGGGISGRMYFVKANQPEGPWSAPEIIDIPEALQSQGIGLGVDNSIFIDDDNKWYMLTKAGQSNNHIVELGEDGQPNGNIIDLTWLNPEEEGLPYGWAEGPVMWKYKGYYYYSFAQHLVGSQYVMRSDTLSDEKSEWTIVGSNIFTGTSGKFYAPNHISPAVMLEDSTSWIIAQSYNSDYKAHGRQGLLCQVIYDDNDFPKILRPQQDETTAPDLPDSGIPWMVPHSDNFNSETVNPEWSFLGYTPDNTYSLTEKPGWLKLSPKGSKGQNTVIKNDGEHSYSLITKVEFEPESQTDEAGLWVINGPETHQVKVASSINAESKKVFIFSFQNTLDEPGDTLFEVENTLDSAIVWLKLIRNEHYMSGYYSPDGISWTQIGNEIIVSEIDVDQTDYNDFTGNQQGLFTKGKSAFFDFYIYRDGYTPISASNPTNRYKVMSITNAKPPNTLALINNDDWVMYAGVEFGNDDYQKHADSISIVATCASTGGVIEVLIDSLTGTKIAELNISNTGGNYNYQPFTESITEEVSGYHDVYLKFSGSSRSELFRIYTISLIDKDINTSVELLANKFLDGLYLEVFYPSAQNTSVDIRYSIPENSKVSIKIFDLNGKEITGIFEGSLQAGDYSSYFNTQALKNGIYLCTLKAGNFSVTKKLITIK